MKRAPIVLTATAAGVAGTLGFTPHSRSPTIASAGTSTSTPAPSPSSGSSSSSSSSSKTVTGDASTQYGPIQLKVTMSGGKITSIEPVQLPSGDPKSSEISAYAEPLLRQSALTKQSANVDAVSGATYTSDGYRTALQAALDQVGAAQSTTSSSASAG